MKNPPDFIRQFRRTVWRRDYPFQIACVQPPLPSKKIGEGVSVGKGTTVHRLVSDGQSISTFSVKTAKTKIPVTSVFNDSEGLDGTTVCRYPLVRRPHYSARLILFGSRDPSEFARDCVEEAVQGLGIAMSTVASEKNGKCCLSATCFTNSDISSCVLFHWCFEGTTSWKSHILIPSNPLIHFRYGKKYIY